MNFSSGESNFYVRGDKCQDEFVEQSTNARQIVPVLFLSIFLPSSSMEDISHYIAPLNYSPPTLVHLVHHLSHHLSSCPINFLLQLF